MATLMTPLAEDEFDNPAAVKVAASLDGFALYFSRSLIPYRRNPGPYARWKVIGIQTLRDLAKGESVGLEFRVDGSGLLRIDIIRSDGTVLHIPSVEIGEGATSEERGKMPELKELESRIAVISPKLVPSQRTRIEALSRAVYSLREGEGYGGAITLLDTMVTEMERALKT